MKLPVKITIARSTGGNTADCIRIDLQDPKSGVQFMSGYMTLEDFASAITGHAYCDVDAELRGLENIGKTFVREDRCVIYPNNTYYYLRGGREQMSAWLVATRGEPGWHVDAYLGGQKSVAQRDGKTFLYYSVYKYVEDTP